VRSFYRLVANAVVASTTNNFLWFALTFWVYLETRSVIASSVIGGSYMLLFAASGIFFGTFVDRNKRKTSMVLSNASSLVLFVLAGVVYLVAPEDSSPNLSQPLTWAFITLVLAGAIAGNLRGVALSTTVTLLVPDDRRDKANGLVGTANGVAFALTSVFSGLAIGQLGMGACIVITIGLTAIAGAHLATIHIENDSAPHIHDGAPAEGPTKFDARGALLAVRAVPGLLALLFFSTFNNFLGGVFMALMDPYGLELVPVETWGVLLAVSSFGFIVGGLIVARRGLGPNPVRTLLLVNVAIWSITILFPIRSLVIPLAIGFFLYMVVIPIAESSEQTIIQKVVPYREQGRVFGFAQTVETAASPVTAFLIGPIAQAWVIPFMTDGAGAEAVGSWFGTGPDRGMALIFIVAGSIGLLMTILALNSRAYRNISRSYAELKPEPAITEEVKGS
jgi:DHA3 family multidrug efflux protein-like MFS transporter